MTQKFLADINCSRAVRSGSDVHMWPRLAYCYCSNTKIRVVPCFVVVDCCIGCTFVEESCFNASQKLFVNMFMLRNLSNFREFCISYVIYIQLSGSEFYVNVSIGLFYALIYTEL